MSSVCSTCHAEIEWAKFAKSLRPVPLDRGLWPNGNLEVVSRHQDGTPLVAVVPIAERDGLPLRRAHFVSCPDADRHRRGD